MLESIFSYLLRTVLRIFLEPPKYVDGKVRFDVDLFERVGRFGIGVHLAWNVSGLKCA